MTTNPNDEKNTALDEKAQASAPATAAADSAASGAPTAEPARKKKNVFTRVVGWFRQKFKRDDEHYISGKDSRKIAKENLRLTRMYEKRKKRRVPRSEYTSKMLDDGNVVEFDNLHTYFFTDAGVVKAVDGVTFAIPVGKTVGVVGESGCGKSVTSLSLMQLVQAPQGQIVEGAIRFKTQDFVTGPDSKPIPVYERDENGNVLTRPKLDRFGRPVLAEGEPVLEKVQATAKSGLPAFEMEDVVYDIAKMPMQEMRRIRGREVSMIFQEPMTSLNPVFTVGYQLDEMVLLHTPGATKAVARGRSLEMLNVVGIAMPERVYKSYPHELSGGMRQRVMIAMALSCNPRLIIADEPTTALDVTIQAQILDLLRGVKDRLGCSIMLITHDLGVIAEMADLVVVMYAGRIVEMGTAEEIFDRPLHPYTIGLQKSKPIVNRQVKRLYSIKGQVPNPINMPSFCYFRDRCDFCTAECARAYPPLTQVTPTHSVSCYRYRKAPENPETAGEPKNDTGEPNADTVEPKADAGAGAKTDAGKQKNEAGEPNADTVEPNNDAGAGAKAGAGEPKKTDKKSVGTDGGQKRGK